MGVNMDSVLGIPHNTYHFINDFGMNIYVLGILVFVLVAYYIFFSQLSVNTDTGEKSVYARLLEIFLWGVFIALILLNGLQYFFNVNFTTNISSLFSDTPNLDVKVKEMDNYDANAIGSAYGSDINMKSNVPNQRGGDEGRGDQGGDGYQDDGNQRSDNQGQMKKDGENQKGEEKDILTEIKEKITGDEDTTVELSSETGVFHIPTNKFGYEESKQICKAYGARLANYNDLEQAYEDGGDWCSYGWSDNQMVLYPTQKKRWDKLQKIKGHENDCGRPGINGGYIGNPNAEFGINCYGRRPKMRESDELRMKNATIFPKTADEMEFEKNVNDWKKKLPDMHVSPFNYESWDA